MAGALALIVLGSAGYLTSLGCRWARAHHRRVGWHFGLIGSAAAVVATAGLMVLGFALQAGSWGYKFDLRPAVVPFCAITGAIAIIPAEIVVWRQRRKRT